MSIDGMQLDRFEAGAEYLVGTTLGAFLLADGWAVPIDEPPPVHAQPRRARRAAAAQKKSGTKR
jgi:endonuclease YncB( thermonuclease family)